MAAPPPSPELPPIPPLVEPPDWGRLPIRECGEPLVPLVGDDEAAGIFVRAQYVLDGIPGAPETVWVRAGVRERLIRAASSLPPGIALCVFDGFRPLAVQQYLYDSYRAQVAPNFPGATEEELHVIVTQFVAAPSADPLRPPPHRGGGAVDVFLVRRSSGTPLPMGTEPDETAPASLTRWFEEHPQEPFTTNRRILYHAMTGAGFTNYLGEWWHYDYGNQRWANCAGQECAVYGMVDEPKDGALIAST